MLYSAQHKLLFSWCKTHIKIWQVDGIRASLCNTYSSEGISNLCLSEHEFAATIIEGDSSVVAIANLSGCCEKPVRSDRVFEAPGVCIEQWDHDNEYLFAMGKSSQKRPFQDARLTRGCLFDRVTGALLYQSPACSAVKFMRYNSHFREIYFSQDASPQLHVLSCSNNPQGDFSLTFKGMPVPYSATVSPLGTCLALLCDESPIHRNAYVVFVKLAPTHTYCSLQISNLFFRWTDKPFFIDEQSCVVPAFASEEVGIYPTRLVAMGQSRHGVKAFFESAGE